MTHMKWNNSISNDYNFNWAFIIDDDVLVFPEGIKAFLNENANYSEAYGTPGCGSHNIGGFCGGGGYAISKQAIGLIIEKSGSSKNFLNCYMDKAKELEYSDIVTSWFLQEHGIQLKPMPGLHPWKTDENSLDKIKDYIQKGNPVYSLHYVTGSMKNYTLIVNNAKN